MEDTYFVELYLLFYKIILKYILDQLIASVFQFALRNPAIKREIRTSYHLMKPNGTTQYRLLFKS